MLALAAVTLYLILIAPVRVGATVSWRTGKLPRGYAGVTVWGVAARAPWRVFRDEEGKLQFSLDRKRQAPKKPDGEGLRRALRVVKAIKTGNIARKTLTKSLSIEALSARLTLSLPAASLTATVCAALNILLGKHAKDIAVRPDFTGRSALDASCIIGFRLGNLITACALGAGAYLKTIKEEKYGSSPHRRIDAHDA